MLCLSFFYEEILNSFFSISFDKLSGPDGFTSKFFKGTWHIICSTYLEAIKFFFTTVKLPDRTKHYVITLIPKNLRAKFLNDYIPISLCNTIYKVIAKLIAFKLKLNFPKIVSTMQTAFLQGKDIDKNIILVNEMIYDFNSNSTRSKFVLKLTL